MMVQLNVKEQKQMEMLKSQVDSLFKVFEGILGVVKTNKMNKKELVGHNDYAVSMMSVFGATCQSFRAEKEIRVLQAAHGYFEESGDALSKADADFFAPWFNYMRCALTSSDPLPSLDISTQSHELANQAMTRNINGIMSTMLGMAHKTTKQKKDIDNNPVQYADRNEELIRSSKNRFRSNKGNDSECTDLNGMYFMSGGGQNVKFGKPSAVKHNKGMDIDGDDDDNDDEHQIPNAFVKRGPKKMDVNGMEVKVRYPLPCKVVGGQGGRYLVVFANPFGGEETEVAAKDMEFDHKKVGKAEKEYISSKKYYTVKDLGYTAIRDLL